MNAAAVRRLENYLQDIGQVLGNDSRRGSFAIYAVGLLGNAERKSVEPLAARACPFPEKTDAMHQRLLHFAAESKWSDRQVRRLATQYALEAMTKREPVEAWILDDTGFLMRIPTIEIRRSDPSRSGAKPMWLDQVVAESSFRREGPFSTSL